MSFAWTFLSYFWQIINKYGRTVRFRYWLSEWQAQHKTVVDFSSISSHVIPNLRIWVAKDINFVCSWPYIHNIWRNYKILTISVAKLDVLIWNSAVKHVKYGRRSRRFKTRQNKLFANTFVVFLYFWFWIFEEKHTWKFIRTGKYCRNTTEKGVLGRKFPPNILHVEASHNSGRSAHAHS